MKKENYNILPLLQTVEASSGIQSADYPLTATIFQNISLLQLQITEHDTQSFCTSIPLFLQLNITQHSMKSSLILSLQYIFDSFDSTEIKYPSNIEMLILYYVIATISHHKSMNYYIEIYQSYQSYQSSLSST